jgi:hypothetical protein
MIGFIDQNGNYFECETDALGIFDEDGARIGGPLIVPRRPDADSEYDAATGKWKARVLTLEETKERQKAAIEAAAASKAERIDDAMLRVLVAVAEGAQPAPADMAKLVKNAAVIAARDSGLTAVDAAKSKADVGKVSVKWE